MAENRILKKYKVLLNPASTTTYNYGAELLGNRRRLPEEVVARPALMD